MENSNRTNDDLMEESFVQDCLRRTIAGHAEQCKSLFSQYMGDPKFLPDPTVVDDQRARFMLWAANMHVHGPVDVSLDYRLRSSPTIVDIIHQLIEVVCATLKSLKPIDDAPKTPSRNEQRISLHVDSDVTMRTDEEGDSDSDMSQAEENISKITDIIGGTVTRLNRLSYAVRNSASFDFTSPAGLCRDDREANSAVDQLRAYTERYICLQYPTAPDSLRSALVEANALRLRRLYYLRSHRRRVDLSIQKQPFPPAVVQLAKKETTSAAHLDPSVQSMPATHDQPSGPVNPPVPVTSETTARYSTVKDLYVKIMTEAPRTKSGLLNKELFPPLPPTSKCPYCGFTIGFESTASWHDHVIRDLEPFICVFEMCRESGQHETGPLTFATSEAWVSHMRNAHNQVWECRAPSHKPTIFEEETQYKAHVVKEHGIPKKYATALSNAARRPGLDRSPECPFCDDFQPPKSDESSAVFSSEALETHVAAHLKEIGLLTLRNFPSDACKDAENVESDRPLEDSGPSFGSLRSSLNSSQDEEALDLQRANLTKQANSTKRDGSRKRDGSKKRDGSTKRAGLMKHTSSVKCASSTKQADSNRRACKSEPVARTLRSGRNIVPVARRT